MLVFNNSLRTAGAYAAPECKILDIALESSVLSGSAELELGAGPDLGIGQEFDF